MKFIDWYNFDFVENKVMDGIGDIYMKVMRKKSFSRSDVMLDSLMKITDAIQLFGDYNLMLIMFEEQNSYKTICALVYKEDN